MARVPLMLLVLKLHFLALKMEIEFAYSRVYLNAQLDKCLLIHVCKNLVPSSQDVAHFHQSGEFFALFQAILLPYTILF